MYELVLMMALSNGSAMTSAPAEADAPAVKTYGLHGHRAYRHRRGGCHGGGWGGCCGSGYGGWGCSGGYAGGYGGCMGGGGGYGCMGGDGMAGGYGCTGGYGMAGGYGCMGSYGMAGGYSGCTGGYAMDGGAGAGSGYASYYGGAYPMGYSSFYGPTYSLPTTDLNRTATYQGQPRGDTAAGTRANANQATLVVDLPANARLTIDGQLTHLTSATRTFVTPPLDPGQEYFYDLKAELNRDGRTVTATKRVTVRPGQESHVRLDFAGQTAATTE